LPQEDKLFKDLDKSLNEKRDSTEKREKWPYEGRIKFENVTMRYRENLETSVRGLNFEAQPGMKVGIVGRTGAGKSSILQILFRLVDPEEGKIEIDGIDIKDMGLHMLRKNIAYIPQTPFLIQGSVRENLDPFEEFSDEEIWATLR
jgi:ABC-type multidrug transport system fused ATPase/permease subunit